MMRISSLLLLVTAVAARDRTITTSASSGHVFSFFISPQYFNWSKQEDDDGTKTKRREKSLLRYRPTLVNQPSLPRWLKYHYSEDYKTGLLYGVPEKTQESRLQILATNRDTFEASSFYLVIDTVDDDSNQDFHVRLKIDNLNIEDIFDKRRLDRLMELFKTKFWMTASEDLQLTFAESALNLGGRRPLKPSFKDGIVVQLSSSHNFSEALINLDAETEPLRKHQSCSYKRVSVERHFRQSGFAVDWCSFRIITKQLAKSEDRVTRRPTIESNWIFPQRSQLQRQSKYPQIIAGIIGPILIFALFTLGVGFLLWTDCTNEKANSNIFIDSLFDVFEDCFGHKKETLEQQELLMRNNNNQTKESNENDTTNGLSRTGSPAMSQRDVRSLSQRDLRASSIQRQSETLRSLGRRRDVTPRLAATPSMSVDGSSLHSRSRTGSPCPSKCGKNKEHDRIIF